MESDPVTESKKRSFVEITAQELKHKFRAKADSKLASFLCLTFLQLSRTSTSTSSTTSRTPAP